MKANMENDLKALGFTDVQIKQIEEVQKKYNMKPSTAPKKEMPIVAMLTYTKDTKNGKKGETKNLNMKNLLNIATHGLDEVKAKDVMRRLKNGETIEKNCKSIKMIKIEKAVR